MISQQMQKKHEKIQQPFVKETLNKVHIEEPYINIVKALYDKPTMNTILDGEKLNSSKIRIKNKDVHSSHFYSTQYWKFQPQELGKKEKDIQIGKEVKLSLLANDMVQI